MTDVRQLFAAPHTALVDLAIELYGARTWDGPTMTEQVFRTWADGVRHGMAHFYAPPCEALASRDPGACGPLDLRPYQREAVDAARGMFRR